MSKKRSRDKGIFPLTSLRSELPLSVLCVPKCHKIPGEAGGIFGGPHTKGTLKIEDFLKTGLLNHSVTPTLSRCSVVGLSPASSHVASTHSCRSSAFPTRL